MQDISQQCMGQRYAKVEADSYAITRILWSKWLSDMRHSFTDAAHVLILLEWCVGECRGIRLMGVLKASRLQRDRRQAKNAVEPRQLLCGPKLCILPGQLSLP